MPLEETREPTWPPKSPYQALLSSPRGRKKVQDRRAQSPSPSRRRCLSASATQAVDSRLLDDEDEDEETLNLKLQAIEARLKLKKLQQAKTRLANGSDAENDRAGHTLVPKSRTSSSTQGQRSNNESVLVPLSPSKDRRPQKEPDSPARVRLGIDKGIRAQEVSLKRASSFRSNSQNTKGGQKSGSSTLSRQSTANVFTSGNLHKSKSFSDRIAEIRQTTREWEEKQARIQKSRNRAFGYQLEQETRKHSSSATSTTDTLSSQPSSSRANKISSVAMSASRVASAKLQESQSSSTDSPAEKDNSSSFDSFSGFHLSKRLIPHSNLARLLEDKETYQLPKLLKEVKSPDYEPPDVESDYVVLGIISRKTEPLTKKNTAKTGSLDETDQDGTDNKSKFMVLKLTDLKWELDLFIFDTGFSKFWKLPLGAVVAILNPGIMPPRNRDTGQFSLKLSSSEDTILEIGTARDLGFCTALKRDGKECESWIDKRKTEFCEFHVSLRVNKAKSGRMEVNTMTGFGSGKKGGFGNKSGKYRQGNNGLRLEGKHHDSFLHETMYIVSGSTAKLLDEESDITQALERGCSRQELDRRRLAERERERELASKLGKIGNGIGGEYMKVKAGDPSTLATQGSNAGTDESSLNRADVTSLGLTRKAGDVTLSPVKRKRSGANAEIDPIGWGGAYKRGLLDTLKPSSDARVRVASPKKRARFMLENKGIREPGRESLGVLNKAAADEDDDDDDLDIV